MEEQHRNDRISVHILPSSANLLGVCFLLVSLIRKFGSPHSTWLDELGIVCVFIFLAASILSYLSIRGNKSHRRFERYADLVFIIGLIVLSFSSIIVLFEA